MSKNLFSSDDYHHASVPLSLSMNYLHLNSDSNKPLLIFFHGYSDSASALLRRAFPDLDSDYEILAPNGLFPVPIQNEKGWKRSFAWYFADYAKNEVVIPPSVSAQAISHLVEKLNLTNRRKVLVGFSQGGFLLPFVFPLLKNVQKMFAIGAAYRVSDYPEHLPTPLDALHGTNDEIITLARAQETFQQLKSKNPKGQFFEFPHLGHTMNDEARALLKARIKEVFS